MRGFVTPLPESQALSSALNGYLKQALQEFIYLGRALPAESKELHRRVVAVIRDCLALNPLQTLAAFGAPGIATPSRCFADRERWPRRREKIRLQFEAALPHILLELAARKLLAPGVSVAWPRPASPLASPSLDAALIVSSSVAGLKFKSGAIEVTGKDGRISEIALQADLRSASLRRAGIELQEPYRRLNDSTRLSLMDHNPISLEEEHPDKLGNAIDLGGRSINEWTAVLREILDMISSGWPELREEMSALLMLIIPVGYHDRLHNSASYRQALGTIYMTLHPNRLTMAEAVIHEFQHNKLNLASYQNPLLNNAFHPLYPSPVRPDPRPLWGVLLAVHAFLAVAAFHRRLRALGHPLCQSPDFAHRLGEIDLKNHEGMNVLRAHADWTAQGREVMEELEELDLRHMEERRQSGLPLAAVKAHDD